MSGITVLPGAEKECLKTITISEPGYYRIGVGVYTVGCRGCFTIVDGKVGDGGSMGGHYGFRGGTYAVMTDTEISQWVRVEPWALSGGSLQFEISCLEGIEDDQLLVRDAEKEAAVDTSIAQMRAGVSIQAHAVRVDGAAGAAYDRGGWSRGL